MRKVLFAALLAAVSVSSASAQDRYDPTVDDNVRAYLVCIQLASGGGDNSNVPDVSAFDEYGYVQWSNGTQKAILCQVVDKDATDAG